MTSPEFRPDLSCPVCQTPFVVTGDTPIARDRALRDWSGCCRPNTPSPLAATGPSAVTARATNVPHAPPTSGPDTGADDRSPSAPSLLRRLFSGVPAHVRRRIGVWPFDPSDFTT